MPICNGKESPSTTHFNWLSIKVEVVKQTTARWPTTDSATIEGAVNWGVAITNKLLQNGCEIPDPKQFVGLVAKRSLISERRRAHTRYEVTNVEIDIVERQKGPPARSPEQLLITKDLAQAIAAAIMTLPEEYSVPLVAWIIKGWSYKRIAAVIGTTEGTARVRISRGKKMVRALMDARGYGG